MGQYERIKTDMDKAGYEGSLAAIFRMQPDYDADKQRPYWGEREDDDDGENIHHESREYVEYGEVEAEYPRRLEDIDITHVIAYLKSVSFGVRYNASNSVNSYRRANPTTKILVGNDDEMVEEKELLLDTDNSEYSEFEIQEAKAKVPYLIKRMYDKSMELGVHLISLIIAYERAKAKVYATNYKRKRDILVMPRHYLAEGVYSMNGDGTIGYRYDENANSGGNREFDRGKAWLNTDSESRRDASELIHCYEIMGIDIRDEDPKIYTKDLVNRMVVSYVTSNVDYVMRKNDHLKQQIYSSYGYMRNVEKKLKDLPLESCEEYACVQPIEPVDTVYAAMQIFVETPNLPDSVKFRSELSDTRTQLNIDAMNVRFIELYNKIEGTNINLDDYYCYDGFFYKKRTNAPLVLDMSRYMKNIVFSECALLNSNGYLVSCTYDVKTQYCDVFDMCQQLEDYSVGISDSKLKWEMLSL